MKRELEERQHKIAGRLGHIVLALEDLALEEILGKWFTGNKATLGLAESCTGGLIAHHITQVHGASAYFTGCIVCYDNDVKHKVLGVKKETIEEFGAISDQSNNKDGMGCTLKIFSKTFSTHLPLQA